MKLEYVTNDTSLDDSTMIVVIVVLSVVIIIMLAYLVYVLYNRSIGGTQKSKIQATVIKKTLIQSEKSVFLITFSFQNASEKSFSVPQSVYESVLEGSTGKIEYKGTRFISWCSDTDPKNIFSS